MEEMVNHKMNTEHWRGKRVFITGHTGFKGSWLSMWLNYLGANVCGYSLSPLTNPSLFELCNIEKDIESIIGDIRDFEKLSKAINDFKPDIVFHLAAQAIVSESYSNPLYTYSTNVIGTVNMLEAVRNSKSIRAVVNVTTDKCYENKEWYWGYREIEPLGGYDPYSNSKACSELVTAAYRSSFFANNDRDAAAVATARAGNVIGGGDWAVNRLVPDCIRALLENKEIYIRNPRAVRPWQHVLEPLRGYLLLAQKLYDNGAEYAEAWNFGPDDKDAKTVGWIAEKLCSKWGGNASYKLDEGNHYHEAQYLKLDCSKAKNRLGWKLKWDIEKALDKVVEWSYAYQKGDSIRNICHKQIKEYELSTNEV